MSFLLDLLCSAPENWLDVPSNHPVYNVILIILFEYLRRVSCYKLRKICTKWGHELQTGMRTYLRFAGNNSSVAIIQGCQRKEKKKKGNGRVVIFTLSWNRFEYSKINARYFIFATVATMKYEFNPIVRLTSKGCSFKRDLWISFSSRLDISIRRATLGYTMGGRREKNM